MHYSSFFLSFASLEEVLSFSIRLTQRLIRSIGFRRTSLSYYARLTIFLFSSSPSDVILPTINLECSTSFHMNPGISLSDEFSWEPLQTRLFVRCDTTGLSTITAEHPATSSSSYLPVQIASISFEVMLRNICQQLAYRDLKYEKN